MVKCDKIILLVMSKLIIHVFAHFIKYSKYCPSSVGVSL